MKKVPKPTTAEIPDPGRLEDQQLFDLIREHLYTAVVSDALDELGYRDQALNPTIRPLTPNLVVVGRAKTILWVDVYEESPDPYAKEIEAVDSIRPGEVAVTCTNESRQNAPWGELLSTAAKARGATGAVVDGLVRDSLKILELDFPLFCSGLRPVDSRGRGAVVDYDVPVKVGGVVIKPRDLVFGDNDGVVVVPQHLEKEAIGKALKKAKQESHSRKALKEGKLLREVYDRYGVL